ncbi:hypothetical protein J4208_01795 [Candidatus Woesearchaeota archaeon]|nr:hypothetical protein [Candidatus Woesearchaeota archaeon]
MAQKNIVPIKEVYNLQDFFRLLKDVPKNISNTETKIRAIVSAVPALENLLFSNKDKEEVRQILRFLEDLSKQLEDLKEESMDKKFLESFEFYCIFKKILELVRFEHTEEKLKLFRNVLLNSITCPRQKISIVYILNKLESLDIGHFEILKWYKDNKYITPHSIGADYDVIALHSVRADYDTNKTRLKDQVSEYYPSFEKDLDVIGFLDSAPAMDGHKRYFITRLGIELIEFVYRDDIEQNP